MKILGKEHLTFSKLLFSKFLWLVSLLFLSQSLFASDPQRYWIFFKDKGELESRSFSQQEAIVRSRMTDEAIERRRLRGPGNAFNKITIHQDLPVSANYVQIMRQMGFHIHQKSRWFNAVSGTASKEILSQISQLEFVKSVETVKQFTEKDKDQEIPKSEEPFIPKQQFENYNHDYGPSFTQAAFHNIPQLHQRGITGDGIRIGIFDTGFNLDHSALQHIRSTLIAERDFINNDNITKNEPGDPFGQDNHGTVTLSVLGGMAEGHLIGVAFNARFFLAKTEDLSSETHVEEDNWAAAAEWSDSLGIDVVSSSLGYSEFGNGEESYTPDDMDGETTIITQAANCLVNRGVVVVSSAGNEGNYSWRIITAPADGKYVIAVGAVDVSNRLASFSSRGPTADRRIKPDVVGLGVDVYAAQSTPSNQAYGPEIGTSLSCPLIAGICALVLQEVPDLVANEMPEVMRRAGDNIHPDNDRGWGRVDAARALAIAGAGIESPNQFSVKLLDYDPFKMNFNFLVGLPQASPITISIYNILGQKVRTISFPGWKGNIPILWDGRNEHGMPLASGIYPFRVKTNLGTLDSKIVILR